MTGVQYTFQELLAPLKDTREAAKLAMMSGQVKIEQAVLAEIMFNGNRDFSQFDFYLEDDRRDLTVRTRDSEQLIDWVEAKMCYTDCLARSVTGYAQPFMYRDLLHEDVIKQTKAVANLPVADRNIRLTSLLFAVHHELPVWRHKYYKGFRNRGRHPATIIEETALNHVRCEISPFLNRTLREEFAIQLDAACRLYVFVFHDPSQFPPQPTAWRNAIQEATQGVAP